MEHLPCVRTHFLVRLFERRKDCCDCGTRKNCFGWAGPALILLPFLSTAACENSITPCRIFFRRLLNSRVNENWPWEGTEPRRRGNFDLSPTALLCRRLASRTGLAGTPNAQSSCLPWPLAASEMRATGLATAGGKFQKHSTLLGSGLPVAAVTGHLDTVLFGSPAVSRSLSSHPHHWFLGPTDIPIS